VIDPDRLGADAERARAAAAHLDDPTRAMIERVVDDLATMVDMFVTRCQLAHEREDELERR
jgi:hypothetical protein